MTKVRVECTPIPDGFLSPQEPLVSVVLRPVPVAPGDPGGIDLESWPELIQGLQFEVSVGIDEANLSRLDPGPTPAFDPPGENTTASALAWWGQLWSDPLVRQAYMELMGATPEPAAEVVWYSYSQLAQIAKETEATGVQLALAARQYRTSGARSFSAKLGPYLKRRLLDPNAKEFEVRDALSLHALDVFGGALTGAAIDELKGVLEPPGDAARARYETMMATSRAAIREASTSGQTNGAVSWNPLAPTEVEPEGFDALVRPSARSVYGAPVAAAQDAGSARTRTEASPQAAGYSGFKRILATDAELGAVQFKEPDYQSDTMTRELAAEIAARRLSGLQAHPALRKFVRLIVDIPISLDGLPDAVKAAGRGVVQITAGTAAAPRAIRTAFQLRSPTQQAPGLFEPCPEPVFKGHSNHSLVPSLPLNEGVVRLRLGRNGTQGGARFNLEIVDAIAGVLAKERAVASTAGAIAKGATFHEAPSGSTGLRTRGLMLLDTEANVPAIIAEERQAKPIGAAATLFAEDLVDGYRLDVVAPNGEVYPAGARRLRYDVLNAAFKSSSPYAYRAFEGRDDGYILPLPRTWTKESEAEGAPEKRSVVASEVVLTWTGDNHGLPALYRDDEFTSANAEADLPVVIEAAFKPEVMGPILRVGGQYKYMLRARKLNGSSITSAASALLAAEHALGEGRNFYTFVPIERAPAPTILVPLGEKLATTVVQDDQPSSQVLIVSAGESGRRIIVSPKIGFEPAEQQGQFDPKKAGGESPGSANARALRRVQFGAYLNIQKDGRGNFPPLVPEGPEGRDIALAYREQPVPKDPPAEPYYVDRTLCTLGTRLRATRFTTHFALQSETAAGEIAFWERSASDRRNPGQGFDPEKVQPVVLEVYGLGGGKSRIVKAVAQLGGRQVPVIRVEVGPADTLELEVWANRTGEVALDHPLAKAGLRRFGVMSSLTSLTSAQREQWWSEQTADTRMDPLSESVRFRIEHPVQRPLEGPAFGRIFGCTHALDEAEWRRIATNPRDRDARAATSLFSWGSIVIDRKSTGKVWAECERIDLGGRRVARTTKQENPFAVDQNDLWVHEPAVLTNRLFTLDHVDAVEPAGNENEAAYLSRANSVDIAAELMARDASLSADFASDRAHRLIVRLVAQSRFVAPGAGDDVGTLASAEKADCELASRGAVVPSGARELWLKATRPPAPPTIGRDRGSLYQREFRADPNGQVTLVHVYRCWLGSDWFDSGESERLAVLCRDPTQPAPTAWLSGQLSRWGGDMSMAPRKELRIEPADFANSTYLDPRQLVGAEMATGILQPPGQAPAGDARGHRVQLALFEPKFHSGFGRWYCDVEFAAAHTFRIALKLVLARHQEHAIDGCRLSSPVPIDAVILHQPWSFGAKRSGRSVAVTATGPAYTERAPVVDGLATPISPGLAAARAAEPLVIVELERLDLDGRPLGTADPDGRPIIARSTDEGVAKELGYGPQAKPGIPDGQVRWTFSLPVPDIDGETEFAVRISLASAHANAQANPEIWPTDAMARSAAEQDGPLVYLPEPIVAQLRI